MTENVGRSLVIKDIEDIRHSREGGTLEHDLF